MMDDLLSNLKREPDEKESVGDQLEFSTTHITKGETVLFKIGKKNLNESNFFLPILIVFLAVGISVGNFSSRVRGIGFCLLLGVTWLLHRRWSRGVVSESVLVSGDLGIQLFSHQRNGAVHSLVYLEKSRIRKILVLEAFTVMKVIVYLVLQVGNKDEPNLPDSPYSSKSSLAASCPTSLFLPFSYFELPQAHLIQIRAQIKAILQLD